MTGHFFQASMEQLRIELGLNINILQERFTDYSFILNTDSMVKTMWSFMTANNITLDDQTPTVSLLRENDMPIMDQILNSTILTTKEKQIANKCRNLTK